MSDHGEISTPNSGYSTPVPELDDHRHQSASVPRADRPRRGTFDSLYGARRLDADDGDNARQTELGQPAIKIRDFEEAVVDDDAVDGSPALIRTRRPTIDTTERSLSPPNSVKAFAEARKRERGLSVSEGRVDRRVDEHELHRTNSVASRHSLRSRARTAPDDDASSLNTNKSVEEDVCFPVQEEHSGDRLNIDFDYLENFILSEAALQDVERRDSVRTFDDLRPGTAVPAAGPTVVTVDGDFLELPSDTTGAHDDKEKVGSIKDAGKTSATLKDPNRFNFFSSAWESTIHAPHFGDLVLPGEDVRGLFSFPKGETDGVWWLNVSSPTDDEVRGICRAFGVHPLTIEDIAFRETREKIELFQSYYFACFRSFNVVDDEDGEKEFEPFYIYVIVFREGTLSFSSMPNAHASSVTKRISALKDYVALSSDWICYALIDNIVDSFAPWIQKLEHDTELIEDEVFVARTDDMQQFLRKIGNIRKNVMAVMRLLGGKADVLKGFTKRCNADYKVTPRMDIGLYLGDIQDHVVTMMTSLGHFEKMLSRSHSNYLAQLSIDSISQGTNTNRVLTKLTFLASIIVPLNVITGLFGMNVHVPWQDDDNLIAFGGVIGFLVLFIVICLAVARRLRYI